MWKKSTKVDKMIGQKFGKLTILGRVENDKHGAKQYLCKCECGNCSKVKITNLRSGNTKSCRHCDDPKPGEKFGKLTVIRETDDKDNQGRYLYECKCDCGNMTKKNKTCLKLGRTKSCGHCNEPKPGEKIGKLTVIRRTNEKDNNNNYYYECRCECGNLIKVRRDNLKNKRSKSCGCGHSHGEYDIGTFLESNFISYVKEKEIEKLTTSKGSHPRFDFQVFNKNNSCFYLEFHGEQHYWEIERCPEFGELQRKETDPMKIKYCEDDQLSLHIINCFEDVESSLMRILYYREMLTPERLERNKAVYKIKRTLFTDKNGHLSIFSDREDIRAAA